LTSFFAGINDVYALQAM